ncbi:bifunctional metallophosphatase/5'-nucleotidase [Virgibacillus sp. DJP39]|uniref:bifunctional metallophosphatase/5'-nucleotidase n=1 Tax=Virgibacillus sp. DJP39 TaxID=3409790 RepID=UPI003BB4AE8E
MEEKLFFYYTNDLHSNFDQWSRVTGYLKEAREDKRIAKQSSWLVDIGDHVDRVNPIAEAFKGKANVQLMNDIGYDIATFGNNEGITLAHEDFYHLYDEADFDVVCANLNNIRGDNPQWVQPSVTVKTKGGVRIGVLGLTAPFNAFYELLDWHVSHPFDVLDAYVSELAKHTDIIVLLSHLGITEDREIARRYNDVDVIIGGHTHHLLRTGETINNTIITAAGKHCAFVGEVILTWDHNQRQLVRKEAYTTDITHRAKDLQTEQKLNELISEADKILDEKITTLDKTIEVNWFKNTPIMEKLTATLKKWTEADCAMLNAGVLLDQIESGDVSLKDIHRICPHPINPCVVQLKGDELVEVIRASFTKEFMELKLKGFGFRGEVLGRMIFAGLEVETEVKKDGQEHVKNVTINNQPIDHNHTYHVATADMFTFGRLLPEIAKSESKRYFLPEFLRDLLARTLNEEYGQAN